MSKKLEYNAATPLYTSDALAWRIDQLDGVMSGLLAAGKPLVVFVHGRGDEPAKSLRGGTFTKGLAVHKIELGYRASVLMFNWDSAFRKPFVLDRTRPFAHAGAGGKSLAAFLAALRAWRQAHPGHPAPVLLVHSMGSIVLQHAVEEGGWLNGEAIFRHVVLSEPDADDVGHADWLGRLAEQESVFVTFNADDKVLRKSTDDRPHGAHALGLGTDQPLAPGARYIDLTGMGAVGSDKDDDHEVFGKGAMNGQRFVCEFFEQALRGDDVLLDPASNVESVSRGQVYRLRVEYAPDAPCLKIPKLPQEKVPDAFAGLPPSSGG